MALHETGVAELSKLGSSSHPETRRCQRAPIHLDRHGTASRPRIDDLVFARKRGRQFGVIEAPRPQSQNDTYRREAHGEPQELQRL